jgi:beta-glucosidase
MRGINNTCSGNINAIPRLNFPGLCVSDAGNGLVRYQSFRTRRVSTDDDIEKHRLRVWLPIRTSCRREVCVHPSMFSSKADYEPSWNKSSAHERAKEMGLEFYKKGVNVLLGPVVGPIGSIAEGGRNWEGVSTISPLDPTQLTTFVVHQ